MNDLPLGTNPKPLDFPHFPSRTHAFVWRNWELVPIQRLAKILGTNEANVTALAAAMGLRTPPRVNPDWLEKSYIHLVRGNWHLLPYEQLLELLGWDAAKLAFHLKEEDFLFHKLGSLKPDCPPLSYHPPTDTEKQAAAWIKATAESHFPDLRTVKPSYFKFLDDLAAHQSKNDKPTRQAFKDSFCSAYCEAQLHSGLKTLSDGMLAAMADSGLTGLWLGAILYTLVRLDKAPELSRDRDYLLGVLRSLSARAAKYGLDIYLYLNEPRGLPRGAVTHYPEWQGAPDCLCSSAPGALDWLRHACAELFSEVPRLGGVFTITMSENGTNCLSRGQQALCPRCANRTHWEVVAEVNNTIAAGVKQAKPEARVIAWNWAWKEEWAPRAIDLLSPDVEFMSTSEWKLPTNVGGVSGEVIDYSISKPGPSEFSLRQWRHATKRGLKTNAKAQFNNSWECSAVPYIPAVYLAEEHIQNLRSAGIGGVMAGWTLGGYPGGNLELLNFSPDELAEKNFGPAAAPLIKQAWRSFSEAFREFPLHQTSQLYTAPQNYGPMNLLHAQPTGYRASMVGYPYDDLRAWRGDHYPEEVFEAQFRKLSEEWEQGLKAVEAARPLVPAAKAGAFEDLATVAAACHCHFRSVYLQICFVRRRGDGAKLTPILDEEIELAKRLRNICLRDSRIGFEASNHYYYSLNDLMEKVLNCEHLKKELSCV